MSWYGILFLTLGVSAAVAFLVYFLAHKKGPVPVDGDELVRAERNRNEVVAKAQRLKVEQLEMLTKELASKLQDNRDALAKRMLEVHDDARQEFDRLVSRDDDMLERVGRILESSRRRRRPQG